MDRAEHVDPFGFAAVWLVVFVSPRAARQRADDPTAPVPQSGRARVPVDRLLRRRVVYGTNQFLPLYFQDSLFVSPTESGLRMMPMMMGVTADRSSSVVSSLARAATAGTRSWAARWASSVWWRSPDRRQHQYWTLVVPMLAVGFAMGAMFTSTSIAAQNAVEFQRPRRGDSDGHVLPLARRFDRARRVRQRAQLDHPQRDPGAARTSRLMPPPTSSVHPTNPALPVDVPRRGHRQHRPRRQPHLLDLRRLHGVRIRGRAAAARACPADMRRHH